MKRFFVPRYQERSRHASGIFDKHEMLYRSADFPGAEGQSVLQERFTFTNDAVFDQEGFAVAENVQKSLLNGENTHHTLGVAEGPLAMFQNSIDD